MNSFGLNGRPMRLIIDGAIAANVIKDGKRLAYDVLLDSGGGYGTGAAWEDLSRYSPRAGKRAPNVVSLVDGDGGFAAMVASMEPWYDGKDRWMRVKFIQYHPAPPRRLVAA